MCFNGASNVSSIFHCDSAIITYCTSSTKHIHTLCCLSNELQRILFVYYGVYISLLEGELRRRRSWRCFSNLLFISLRRGRLPYHWENSEERHQTAHTSLLVFQCKHQSSFAAFVVCLPSLFFSLLFLFFGDMIQIRRRLNKNRWACEKCVTERIQQILKVAENFQLNFPHLLWHNFELSRIFMWKSLSTHRKQRPSQVLIEKVLAGIR